MSINLNRYSAFLVCGVALSILLIIIMIRSEDHRRSEPRRSDLPNGARIQIQSPEAEAKTSPRAVGEAGRETIKSQRLQYLRNMFDSGGYGNCIDEAESVEELAKVWAWLRAIEDTGEFDKTNRRILNELRDRILGRMSFFGGTGQAIGILEDAFGPGTERSGFLFTIFHGSGLPVSSLLELAGDRSHGDEVAAALLGIGSRIARLDSFPAGGDLQALVAQPGGLDALKTGLLEYATYKAAHQSSEEMIARAQEVFSASRDLIEAGELGPAFFDEIVVRIGSLLPFETWELLSAESSPLLGDPVVTAPILKAMSRVEPLRALDLVASDPQLPGHALQNSMVAALQTDVSAATEWYESNSSSLLGNRRDHLMAAFALVGADHNEPGTAWEWVAQIEDPQIRRTAEGRVWQAELGQVRQEAREAPRATVEAMVSGESPHATYWIETAMAEWMAQDTASAQAWYEENRSSLTPEQNEPVALAYARRAISQGDLDTATEWARHVISQKHRAKIEAELAAAAETEAP